MRKIETGLIYETLYNIIRRSVCNVEPGVVEALSSAVCAESCEAAKFALRTIIESDNIAAKEDIPACQDTGMAVIFADIGQEVCLDGEYFEKVINDAVRDAYRDGYFRCSVLTPLERINTGDNTPAIIHTRIVPGDRLTLSFLAKGFGSENMSRLYMLTPAQGIEGIKEKVKETVKEAGGKPCPPIILGIGIGGTMEQCALMAKRALLTEQGKRNPDPKIATLETELLQIINSLKIGAMGFGGDVTALDVHILTCPTHIASLPLAVNVQCHSVRHSRITI